jgi:hypothetical protein
MGWKELIVAYTISIVCLFLFIWSASAAGIQRFTDSQGVIHITNLGGTDQDKGALAGDNQAPVPRLTFQGPENKLEKMRILGIQPPDEKSTDPPEPPGSEAKTTPAREENH